MKKFLISLINFKSFIFFVTFLFLIILSAHDYDRFPFGAHADEQAFAWAGINILRNGVPVSWSHFDYPKENIVFKGLVGEKEGTNIGVTLVKPWFDHPPLFAIISASISYFKGVPWPSILPASFMRLPSVVAFWLTLLGVFYLTKKKFGFWMGLGSMFILGTVPTFVFAGRFALPEVFFALFLVTMVICFIKFEESKNALWIVPIGILPGIAMLMKFTGIFLLPLFLFYLIRDRRFKFAILLLLMQIPFILIVYWYAHLYDFGLFIKMFLRQGFRPVGWTSLPFIFSSPGFDISFFYDGWYIFALLSAVILMFIRKKEFNFILWPIFYWLAVVIFTGGQQDMLPWYRFPMFPFLAIALTIVIKKLIARPNFFSSLTFAGMLFSSRYYLTNPFRQEVLPPAFRISFISLLTPSLLIQVDSVRRKFWTNVARLVMILIVVVGVWLNVKLIYGMYTFRCENLTCPIGPGTWVSRFYYPFFWRFIAP